MYIARVHTMVHDETNTLNDETIKYPHRLLSPFLPFFMLLAWRRPTHPSSLQPHFRFNFSLPQQRVTEREERRRYENRERAKYWANNNSCTSIPIGCVNRVRPWKIGWYRSFTFAASHYCRMARPWGPRVVKRPTQFGLPCARSCSAVWAVAWRGGCKYTVQHTHIFEQMSLFALFFFYAMRGTYWQRVFGNDQ